MISNIKSLLTRLSFTHMLLLVVVFFVVSVTARAQSWKYETITLPSNWNAVGFTATGINPRGDIVGAFTDGDGITHGFLMHKGEFTKLDFPDEETGGTLANGINPGGDIVGSFWLNSDPLVGLRGFLLTKDGKWQEISYPNHSWVALQRILPDGTMLGCRHDSDMTSTMRGITIGNGWWSEISAYSSMHYGATPDLGMIVGRWTDTAINQQQGYVIQNGVFDPFIVPGSNLTQAWDVNPDGNIVGVYRISGTTTFRGFLRVGDTYTTIHYPLSLHTRAFGINPKGDVVGSYVAGGTTYGFVARRIDEE